MIKDVYVKYTSFNMNTEAASLLLIIVLVNAVGHRRYYIPLP